VKFADITGPATPLGPQDIPRAATILGVSAAKIGAVMDVESRGRGFHPETQRPIILFEPHVFSRLTDHKFDAAHPDLSYPEWGTLPYPATQGQRYAQLQAAMDLASSAALGSASWGMFQIMGFNSAAAGFESVESMVRAMCQSEGEHLAAFARFIGGNPVMLKALRAGDWAGFARAYNGKSFAQHGYDQKLKSAFARRSA
jgi:hypothetical protein